MEGRVVNPRLAPWAKICRSFGATLGAKARPGPLEQIYRGREDIAVDGAMRVL